MLVETNRRSLITGLICLVAVPAIVRASSLMPVKATVNPFITGVATWGPNHVKFFRVVMIFYDGKNFVLGEWKEV